MSFEDAIRDLKSGQRKHREGLWTGRVEDVDDPKRMNRIRVRLFPIHGSRQQTPTEALPWAEVSDVGGGGPDYGSAGLLYPVGSTVWVMFEMGHVDYPVVVGGRRGRAPARDEAGESGLNPLEYLTLDGQGEEQTWLPEPGVNEQPTDVFEDETTTHPTRTVWQKSYKGHTIVVENKDGEEWLRIIDRAGQVIELSCPVTVEANKNNGEQRGSRTVIDDSGVSQDSLVGGRAYIRIKTLAGQELMLDAKKDEEVIHLLDRIGQAVVIDTKQESISFSAAQALHLVVGGTELHVEDGKIELGGEGAGDKVVLDSKLQSELSRIKDDLTSLKTSFDSHQHLIPTGAVATAGSPVAQANPAPVPVPPPLVPWNPGPSNPGSTASDLVTIKS